MTTQQLPDKDRQKIEQFELTVTRDKASSAMMRTRVDFVTSEKWFGEDHTDDTDRYDGISSTLHYEKTDSAGEFVVGMRLTQCDRLTDSLSYEMLRSNPQMEQEAKDVADEIDMLAGDQLFDLTRLVNPPNKFEVQTASGIMEMIGMGIGHTQKDSLGKLTWIFTTTRPMKDLLDGLGIQSYVIAEGKISAHDEEDSLLCIAYPADALEFVRDNPEQYAFTLEHVEHGLAIATRHTV